MAVVTIIRCGYLRTVATVTAMPLRLDVLVPERLMVCDWQHHEEAVRA